MSAERLRRVGIGIDTGGTFTDAVAVDLATRELLSKAKAHTTRDDLSRGVRAALSALDGSLFADVALVALSTTLATNAVVEGKGARVGLIIAVPDPASFAVPRGLPAVEVAVIAGAHMPDGSVRTALDVGAARAAVERMAPAVDAFAVSTYFSVHNDEHEIALKELVAEVCDAPVVCGHELTQRIGMVERGVTAAYNARLLPLVRDLLDAVRSSLAELGIEAPVMVVKGDGSLTAEPIARDRPVETVMSGPAASVMGACLLSGLTTALVADMGGTTSDIAVVRGSMPAINPDGALVGGWRTRVHALDVRTAGLGGDSTVRVSPEGEASVGPERVVPLCVAAEGFAGFAAQVRELASGAGGEARELRAAPAEPRFLTLVRRPSRQVSAAEEELMAALDGAAVHVGAVEEAGGQFVDVEGLVRSGVLGEIGFTPTDALVASGLLEASADEVAASLAGAQLLALAARTTVDVVLAGVRHAVEERLALELAARALTDDAGGSDPTVEQLALVRHMLGSRDSGVLRAGLSLGVPLVAVGAPAAAWFPGASALLSCELVVPEHAEVANAFGALAGRVVERAEARVKADADETFVVVTPSVRERFDDVATARARAEDLASSSASRAAAAAGAPDAELRLTCDEVVARQASSRDDVFVELTVVATAYGPPFI